MDLSDAEVQHLAEADRREADPPIRVETAMSSRAGQLDWWVKERQQWLGRVRGADGRQRLIRAVDLHLEPDSAARGRACRKMEPLSGAGWDMRFE